LDRRPSSSSARRARRIAEILGLVPGSSGNAFFITLTSAPSSRSWGPAGGQRAPPQRAKLRLYQGSISWRQYGFE